MNRTLLVLAIAIVCPFAADLQAAGNVPEGITVILPDDVKWGPAPPELPNLKLAVLSGDPARKGPFTVRFKLPAGATTAPHSHTTTEHITVLQGTLQMSFGPDPTREKATTLPQGTHLINSAGIPHATWNDTEVVLEIRAEGPFETTFVGKGK